MARQTKQFFPEADSGQSKMILGLKRNEVSRLVTLLTGHNNLNYHCSVRDKEHRPECRFCGYSQETFHHFATSCPRLRGYRLENFMDYNGPVTETGDWNVMDILRFSREPEIAEAIDYYEPPHPGSRGEGGSEDENE